MMGGKLTIGLVLALVASLAYAQYATKQLGAERAANDLLTKQLEQSEADKEAARARAEQLDETLRARELERNAIAGHNSDLRNEIERLKRENAEAGTYLSTVIPRDIISVLLHDGTPAD